LFIAYDSHPPSLRQIHRNNGRRLKTSPQRHQGSKAIVKQQRFIGSVLVARDGKVIFSKGYGLANAELDVPNTPQTKFRLGSITH